jgi:hypothetical protein
VVGRAVLALTYSCAVFRPIRVRESPTVSFFLLLLITVGNLALGFGLAVHLGFGPDFARLAAQWEEFRESRRKHTGPGGPPGPTG